MRPHAKAFPMDREIELVRPETPPMLVRAGMVILMLCMVFFAFDAAEDIFDWAQTGVPLGPTAVVALGVQMLSIPVVGFAALVLRSYVRGLRAENATSLETITLLRGRFQEVMQSRFEDWNLTPAERDVAVLIFKGLNVAQIADARNSAAGTVKAQTTSIFRKVGVSSKSELMSAIIDEFLDGTPLFSTPTTRTRLN